MILVLTSGIHLDWELFFLFHIHIINGFIYIIYMYRFPAAEFQSRQWWEWCIKNEHEKKHSKCLLLTHHSSLKTQKENSIFPWTWQTNKTGTKKGMQLLLCPAPLKSLHLGKNSTNNLKSYYSCGSQACQSKMLPQT